MISRLAALISRNRKGSALVSVLIVFCVFVVLSMAVMALATSSSYQEAGQSNHKQAYFTARSAVSAAMSYIRSDTNLKNTISALSAANSTLQGNYNFSAKGSSDTVKIYASKFGADGRPSVIKVTAQSAVGHIKSTASAYMKLTTGTGATVNPFSNSFYTTGAGTFTFDSNSDVVGNIYSEGDFILKGGSITGNLYAKGSITIENGTGGVHGDAYTGVGFPNGTSKVSGVAQIVPGLNLQIDFSPSSDTVTTLRTEANAVDMTAPIDFGKNTVVTSSGYLRNLNGKGSKNAVTVNTSAGDIWLNITSSVNLNNYQITVTGPNHFYVYLTGNTTLTDPVLIMSDLTDADRAAHVKPPRIFIIGIDDTAAQSVEVGNNAQIDGFAFLPYGTFKSTGGASSTQITVYGGVISELADTGNGNSGTWVHVDPDLTGTPFEGHMPTYTLPGPATWVFDGWSDT